MRVISVISNVLILIIVGTSLYPFNYSSADSLIEATVAGCVVTKINTIGPTDAPNIYIYMIRMANGSLLNVSYTGYPPSPAGEAARENITLNFMNGTISPGDFLVAHGNYDRDTNTVTVTNKGDFIESRTKNACQLK
jgi:hypothetical protein